MLHRNTAVTCRYTLKYNKNTISHMSVCTNRQNIQCIIIMVIINISLYPAGDTKHVKILFKEKNILRNNRFYQDFFYLVTLTVPTCSSINKTWIPSGFLLCASPKWWNFKPLPAMFQAIIWLNSILSTRLWCDEKFISHEFDYYRFP